MKGSFIYEKIVVNAYQNGAESRAEAMKNLQTRLTYVLRT
jgi:hypothetical protein